MEGNNEMVHKKGEEGDMRKKRDSGVVLLLMPAQFFFVEGKICKIYFL